MLVKHKKYIVKVHGRSFLVSLLPGIILFHYLIFHFDLATDLKPELGTPVKLDRSYRSRKNMEPASVLPSCYTCFYMLPFPIFIAFTVN